MESNSGRRGFRCTASERGKPLTTRKHRSIALLALIATAASFLLPFHRGASPVVQAEASGPAPAVTDDGSPAAPPLRYAQYRASHPEASPADAAIDIPVDGFSYGSDCSLLSSLGGYAGSVLATGEDSRVDFPVAVPETGLYQLKQSGIFEIREDPVITKVPNTNTVNIAVKGVESNKNELLFGGGYGGVNGFFVSGSFRTYNFLGMGTTFAVNADVGKYQQLFAVNYTDPWLFGHRIGGTINLFNRKLKYTQFDQKALGHACGQRCVAQHHGHDRVLPGHQRKAQSGHRRAEMPSVGMHARAQRRAFVRGQQAQHIQRGADNRGRQRVGEKVGPRTLAQQFDNRFILANLDL